MGKKDQESRKRIKELTPLLAFDTATNYLIVAVAFNEEQKLGFSKFAARSHQEEIIDAIDDLLKKAKLKIEDVRSIAVGVGPGSYTGVRVGVTAGRTFAHAMGVPLVPVDSLMMQATSTFFEIRKKNPDLEMVKIAIVNDARRREYYYALYSIKEGNKHLEITRLTSPVVLSLSKIKTNIRKEADPFFFVGTDFEFEGEGEILKVKPSYEGLIECALRNLREERLSPWWEVLPVYLRASYAEESLKDESTDGS